MTPPTIARRLAALRRRERFIRLAWGLARLVAVAAVALVVACAVDWWIDLRRETPYALRVGMLVGQIRLAAGLAAVWLLPPLFGRRDDAATALFVEERLPELSHRLISAVQLNRPNADTKGMSPAMIGEVTQEAEDDAKRRSFAALTDHKRLWNALGLLSVVGLFGGATWAVGSETVRTLLARQGLAAVEVPRQFSLRNETNEVWPAGEEVTLRLEIEGPHPPNSMSLDVLVVDDAGSQERLTTPDYKVIEQRSADIGRVDVVAVPVPSALGDFTFHAWYADARLKTPGRVRRVPRPSVVRQDAWTLLPKHVGTTPDGRQYALPQTKGEIVGLPGSSAMVAFITQKPIVKATLELLGTATAEEASKTGGAAAVLRSLPVEVEAIGTEGTVVFDLRPAEIAYRIVVEDEYGFKNLDPARRGIKIVEEDAPQVVLLPEQFAPEAAGMLAKLDAEDFEVEGVPIPLGGSIRIAYGALHPYGLGAARLQYRINEGPWRPYTLQETPSTAETGPFDQRMGAFAKSKPGDQVQFHAIPSADPSRFPGRIEGGGRFDFQTRGLPELQVGDKIEFYVEVGNRQPGSPKFGHSEVRLKAIVSVPQLVQWIDTTLRQEDRIRQLETKQRGVFGK
ncbi:MAG: hypothetical protein U0746_13480 [Gemmataceae bacterium]